MLIADINNRSPLKICNECEQKMLPGGIIFIEQPRLCPVAWLPVMLLAYIYYC